MMILFEPGSQKAPAKAEAAFDSIMIMSTIRSLV